MWVQYKTVTCARVGHRGDSVQGSSTDTGDQPITESGETESWTVNRFIIVKLRLILNLKS